MRRDSDKATEAQGCEKANIFTGDMPIEAALNQLRLRLLDLTGRNRLINFNHTAAKSLQFVHGSIDGVFSRLVGNTESKVTIVPLPEPERGDWTRRDGRLARPEPKEHAVRLGIDTSFELAPRTGRALAAETSGSQLRTLYYAEDLGRHCRKLEREAKLAIEETGANKLYLVFGFLEFPESPDSTKLLQAPLLCTPVAIIKTDTGVFSSFHLTYTGEELADNLSLREKLKRDFGFNLPECDAETEPSIESYLDQIADSIALRPNWRLRRMMTLTLLSFTNMLLVRDIDPSTWPIEEDVSTLLNHPLVRQVFEGRPAQDEAQYADEYPIDDHPKADLPLIYDADSSQHSALIDVLEGHNRVIEGPPGTGKSQTITNLIAAALQDGKKILFVAEKLAALEVVKSRLTQAGLEDFVLELHSNKTNKKRVLEDLEKRTKLRRSSRDNLAPLFEQLQVKHKELKAYADLINSKICNRLDLTLYSVLWRAELNRMRCGDAALSIQGLNYAQATDISGVQLAGLCDRLKYLADQFEAIGAYDRTHPLWGFFPTEFKPGDDLPIQQTLTAFAVKFEGFATAMSNMATLLDSEGVKIGDKGAQALLAALEDVAPADSHAVDLSLLATLFGSDDPEGNKGRALLDELQQRQRLLDHTEREIDLSLTSRSTPTVDAPEVQAALARLQALGLEGSTQEQLKTALSQLRSAVGSALKALVDLKELAGVCALPFAATVEDLTRFDALCKQLRNLPGKWLHLRHSALRIPDAAALLRRGMGALQEIKAERASLDEDLYLDSLPSEAELNDSIRTLREGDAWYRFFQRRWREALKVHRRLERKKSKKCSSERLSQLESLRTHKQREKAWHEDATLKALTGPHFAGEATPFLELVAVAEWIERAYIALEQAHVPSNVFDPLTSDRARVAQLSTHVPRIEQALGAVKNLCAVYESLLRNAHPQVLRELSAESLSTRIHFLKEVSAQLESAEALMTGVVKPEVSAAAGLRAILLSQQLSQLVRELECNREAKELLGHRFKGRQTDLEPALAAHTYGTLVKRRGLPARIERLLLSSDITTNYARLRSYIKAIGQGWSDVADFNAAMGQYGRFEPALWSVKDDAIDSAYAKSLAERTRSAVANVSALLPWVQYVSAREEAVKDQLEPFVLAMERGDLPSSHLERAFVFRFYATIAQIAFQKSRSLSQFSGRRHSSVREEYGALDSKIIKLRGQQIAHDCLKTARPPIGDNGARVGDKTEMQLLNLLMPQQRPRVPVRQLLTRAGRAIQELKPCFMMGPQAVAQFLKPGALHFDIVVMDEASQLRPEQAIGAIARGTQLVVVGDPKQLPPTSFFARMNQTEGDEDGLGQMATTDAESILDVCISHFRPVRTLRWHYRSMHESLIAFSNHRFYRGNLVVFPSPYPKSKALGVRYYYVADGLYENQMNHVEARRVVDAVVDHVLHRAEDSIGVVTLNIKQRDLVAEMLEERLRAVPEATTFKEKWEAEGKGVFVKNLENVQGDERDCIVISTTFGKPRGANVIRQNFGPISRDGGWRRLNVLFTRARKSVAVFSSMRPEDIVEDSSTPEGTRALRSYLEFARDGVIPVSDPTDLPPDSDFEIAVIDVLKGKGYEVVPQLGVAGFRIDIAVRHPAQVSGYLAAIECDGAAYHSGVSVRDRDRIRQEILESLGWRGRIWRIWSTDWFRNPLAETQRLLDFLEGLRSTPLPDDYLASAAAYEQDVVPSVGISLGSDTVEQLAEDLVLRDEAEDLEIQVGDLVAYAPPDNMDGEISARITARQTNPELGLVAENTPLGAILIGSTVGETVVLRVPGRPPQSFLIRSVKRPPEEAIA